MELEILFGNNRYGVQVDIWSEGYIFGELLGGKPMSPDSTTLNLIIKVLEITGKPCKEDNEFLLIVNYLKLC